MSELVVIGGTALFSFSQWEPDKRWCSNGLPNGNIRNQVSLKSGRTMWMGLPIEKVSLPIANAARQAINQLQPQLLERFTTLMQQELNYVYRIE